MVVVKDITGLRFGRLRVIRRKGSERGTATWLCRCDCGTKTIVTGVGLRLGRTRSCGCYARQVGLANTTHGHLRHYRPTTEYSAWRAMISRCYRPSFANFQWYGGKGIRVCKRWRTDFAAFLADMGPKPAPHMFLCRIDKDGDYEPDNCEWRTRGKSRSARTSGHTPLRERGARPAGHRRRNLSWPAGSRTNPAG
jgi:hypothetical protein